MMNMKAIGAAALTMTAMGSGGAAQAQMMENEHIMVATADLDLTRAEGQDRLATRIRHAVNRVCPDIQVRDLQMRVKTLECRAKAMADAKLASEKLLMRRLASAEPAR